MTLNPSGTTTLTGTITTSDNLDMYNLGEFKAGDRIIVDVGAQANGLDADAAIFDANQDLVNENDDRNIDLNQLDPFINHVIRHDSNYYVGIAASPLGAANMLAGNYEAIITITRGGQVPVTSGQVVALDAAGGTMTVAGDTFTVGPFNTGDIDAAYTGMTNEVLDQIVATMNDRYAGLDMQLKVIPRDLGQVPGDCTASTILLGGFSAEAFGLSDDIDHYDADHCDNSIIFTNSFTPIVFGRVLTANELGTAIGNVAAHELGHILGLNHVDNPSDLMDTSGPNTELLTDQIFETSPLDPTIFPIGFQDGLLLLQETLGTLP